MRRAARHRSALSLAAVLLLSAAPAAALTQSEIANYGGPDRQKILEEGARREGAVTFYTAMIVDQATRPLIEAFQKKYPFVKAEYWRGESRAIIQKVLAEMRSDNLVADVVESTGIAGGFIHAGVVQPFTSPELAIYDAKYLDPKHLYAPTRISYFGTAYNTKLVASADAPKSYADLLDAKWKGKIAWRVDADTGSTLFVANLVTAWGEAKAESYLKRFAAQNIVAFDGSARTLVNRVMEGEYPIAVHIFAHHPLISARAGAPVTTVLMEPVASASGTLLLPKGVRHPHAAMLLIDFILSKEGQETLKRSDYFPSRADVEPDDYLKPVVPRYRGLQENYLRPEVMYEQSEKLQALYDRYFN